MTRPSTLEIIADLPNAAQLLCEPVGETALGLLRKTTESNWQPAEPAEFDGQNYNVSIKQVEVVGRLPASRPPSVTTIASVSESYTRESNRSPAISRLTFEGNRFMNGVLAFGVFHCTESGDVERRFDRRVVDTIDDLQSFGNIISVLSSAVSRTVDELDFGSRAA